MEIDEEKIKVQGRLTVYHLAGITWNELIR